MNIEQQINNANIANELDRSTRDKIGETVVEEFNIDDDSRQDWIESNKLAMKLATQVVERKTTPFDGAADIKYPLLSMAAVQFAARAYSQLVNTGGIVKTKVIGRDDSGEKANRAYRISQHMDYQLKERMIDWEDETDSLLIALPIEGCEFKKSYYNRAIGANVSEWIRPKDLVVNYNAKSLEKSSRYTHIISLYPNEIMERIRGGLFLDLDELKQDSSDEEANHRDSDAPHIFYEQHRFLDLDGDGYKEPYIVTVHKQSGRVVRIVVRFDIDGIKYNSKKQIQRIDPIHYITKFPFMKSPDGGFYEMGFGRLLAPLNTSINITLNQIHDAGTLANTQGGFIGKNASLGKNRGGGDVTFEMGEFKQLNYTGDDIRKSIMPLPFKEPSMVLFNVLGLLIDAGEKMASTTDPLMGESPGSNVPATTTLALVEQGLKVFSSVYKRIHRSFGSEFKKLFRLNSIYLDDEEYFLILDDQKAVRRQDYDTKGYDVCPVSDPNEISNTEKLLKSQVLMEMMGAGLNDNEIIKRRLEALQIPDIDKLIPQEGVKPRPDPKLMLEAQKLDIERQKLELEMFKAQYEVMKLQADAIKSMAQAEGVEAGQQVQMYMAQLKAITDQMKAKAQAKRGESN